MNPLRTGILIFDDAEVLDFAGPYEVFSVAGRRQDLDLFSVCMVSVRPGPVAARNGFSVNAKYTLEDCPHLDILVVPGGFGTRREMNNPVVIDWIRARAADADLVLSVCTGALLLAKADLLHGQRATTHAGALDLLQEIAPDTTVLRETRVVDNGRTILSAGVAAGIEMSLCVVARLFGVEQAMETARYMEFPWDPQQALTLSGTAVEQ